MDSKRWHLDENEHFHKCTSLMEALDFPSEHETSSVLFTAAKVKSEGWIAEKVKDKHLSLTGHRNN
jgi:hypothetical protein